MGKLSCEIAGSLASWDTSRTIKATGFGSEEYDTLINRIEERLLELSNAFPFLTLDTLARLLDMSDADKVATEIGVGRAGLLIQGRRAQVRAELVRDTFRKLDEIDIGQVIKTRRILRLNCRTEDECWAARRIVLSFGSDADFQKSISKLRAIFPMYNDLTLARGVIALSYAIEAHIKEEKQSCPLEVPGHWKKRRAELEEQVWQLLREKRSLAGE